MNDRPAPFWWPSERGFVTMGLFGFAVLLIALAAENPRLWNVKLYELILQAVVLTGLLNLVGGFHFAANKEEREAVAKRADNTAKAFEAIAATAATASVAVADTPTPVVVTNSPAEPVPVDDSAKSDAAGPAEPDSGLGPDIDAGELPPEQKL